MNETTRDVHTQSATTGGEGKAGGDVSRKRTWQLVRLLAFFLLALAGEALWLVVTTGTRDAWVIAGDEGWTLFMAVLLCLAYIGLRRALAAYDRWRR